MNVKADCISCNYSQQANIFSACRFITNLRRHTPSVHQNPSADNPFVAKTQNLYFCGR